MGALFRTLGSFFDDYPLVRRWLAPVAFMGALLFPLFTLRFTWVQSAQLTAVFLGFSLTAVAVAVGVILEKLVELSAGKLF